jgi:hypothetical protein
MGTPSEEFPPYWAASPKTVVHWRDLLLGCGALCDRISLCCLHKTLPYIHWITSWACPSGFQNLVHCLVPETLLTSNSPSDKHYSFDFSSSEHFHYYFGRHLLNPSPSYQTVASNPWSWASGVETGHYFQSCCVFHLWQQPSPLAALESPWVLLQPLNPRVPSLSSKSFCFNWFGYTDFQSSQVIPMCSHGGKPLVLIQSLVRTCCTMGISAGNGE